MVTEKGLYTKIEEIFNEEKSEFDNKQMFVVGVSVSEKRQIKVYVDAFEGVSIKNCVALSRMLKNEYENISDRYNIEVSSAGIDKPFRVVNQYRKNIGKNISITKTNGKREKFKLVEVKTNEIVVENKKKEIENISFDDIKAAKEIISFK